MMIKRMPIRNERYIQCISGICEIFCAGELRTKPRITATI
jgi:hypothetical protein